MSGLGRCTFSYNRIPFTYSYGSSSFVAMSEPKQRILVTGGSGYLGQFVILRLKERYQISYTYLTSQLPVDGVEAWKVDMATGDGFDEVFSRGPIAAVINCAAMSQPGLCQQNPDLARAINVPTQLLARLQQQRESTGVEAVLIHLSTDQVYEGTKMHWSEEDACHPVNAYGSSKLEAEVAIQDQWPKHVILRSSIIFGPPAPVPVPRPLFLQFVEGVLKEKTPTTFFEDEFRCPVYVEDIVRIILHILESPEPPRSCLYNMGGPERLSRVDMAHKVAEVRGYDKAAIIPAPSSSISRPFASPADISMSGNKLVKDLGLQLTPFSDAVKQIPCS